jgi:hypothetical protein
VTSTSTEPTRRRHSLRWIVGAFAVGLGSLVEFGSSMSPWLVFGFVVGAMVVADLLALGAYGRRTSRPRALEVCGVGGAALVIQAGGVYFNLVAMGTWLTFWVLPAMAIVVGAGLLTRPGRRAYGVAVLIGSVEGVFAFIAFVAAAFAACNCWD